VVSHNSGRQLVIADNSPAQWSFSRAFEGQTFSLSDIRKLLDADSIPFTFATKTAEKARMAFKCTLKTCDNLNKRGWKLCHIEGVGLKTKRPIEELPITNLVLHFKLLLAPSNHFLIPLDWAGLGEVQEVIEEVKTVENRAVRN
jgi:hypothetical protein